jgi:hypothetical protein
MPDSDRVSKPVNLNESPSLLRYGKEYYARPLLEALDMNRYYV